jgi:RimJ/RimL family protein N-acetyltransferase
MEIKQAHTTDSQTLLRLWQQLEEESPYLLYEAGKREKRGKQELQKWSRFLKSDQLAIFLAETDEEAIGYLLLAGNDTERQRHVAQMTMGVLASHQRQGIGTQLMHHGKHWAVKQRIRRLELTVASQNTAAIAFYLQHDFVFEGIRKQSLFIDNQWHNELYMACLLSS